MLVAPIPKALKSAQIPYRQKSLWSPHASLHYPQIMYSYFFSGTWDGLSIGFQVVLVQIYFSEYSAPKGSRRFRF